MNYNNILNIKNLHANIEDKPIIKGVNLSINLGEVHAIMGKNGSGKSTLAKVIAGHPSYTITQGVIIFDEEKINNYPPESRSHKGLFLGFQYPVEIPGVSNADFLRLAYNSQRKAKQQSELDPLAFFDLVSQKTKFIDMDSAFLTRNVNEGFSGGEKKKNEILQMALLESRLSILDETDSGLDIDALKIISKRINELRKHDNAIILITHYQRLLNYIIPDYIHIMQDGKIVHTGNANLAKQLEEHGYEYIV